MRPILRSVIVHDRDTGGGHYICYARDQLNQWYLYDARHEPQRRSLDEVLRESAYMLFYERAGVALQPALLA